MVGRVGVVGEGVAPSCKGCDYGMKISAFQGGGATSAQPDYRGQNSLSGGCLTMPSVEEELTREGVWLAVGTLAEECPPAHKDSTHSYRTQGSQLCQQF